MPFGKRVRKTASEYNGTYEKSKPADVRDLGEKAGAASLPPEVVVWFIRRCQRQELTSQMAAILWVTTHVVRGVFLGADQLCG